MSNKNLIILLVAILVVGGIFWYFALSNKTSDDSQTAIANPASVYCQDNGGTLQIKTADDGSQSGVCVFANGSQCDEWAYYRGECAPTK